MYNNKIHAPLDFDDWAALAREDPQAFEAERARVIDQAIQNAPARIQHRLRCQQWKLDQIRATSRTPMIACLRINRMLWDTVTGQNGLHACLQMPVDSWHRHEQAEPASVTRLRPCRDQKGK